MQRTTFMRGKHPVVVARVAEPGTATEPERIGALGVEPRDRKKIGPSKLLVLWAAWVQIPPRALSL